MENVGLNVGLVMVGGALVIAVMSIGARTHVHAANGNSTFPPENVVIGSLLLLGLLLAFLADVLK